MEASYKGAFVFYEDAVAGWHQPGAGHFFYRDLKTISSLLIQSIQIVKL